jgi:hypothetical protein
MTNLKSILFILLGIISISMNSQVLPDINVENPSATHYYYENQGQIIDDSGNVRDDILFYTERMQPTIYLAQDKASFVVSRVDTTSTDSETVYNRYRIDMEFVCNPTFNTNSNLRSAQKNINTIGSPCATIHSYEQGGDYLNYYLPQCGSDGITDVPGYKRIVYENVFPNIDYHFYSNNDGLKSYIVIKPGGNPDDILLLFSGQDSIGIIDSNLFLFMTTGYTFSLPQATAFQIDSSNNPFSVGWDPHWLNEGSGYISLMTSTYNTNLPLVIRIAGMTSGGLNKTNGTHIPGLFWSTYYGGSAHDNVRDLKADASSNLYSVMETASPLLPYTSGASQIKLRGATDAYITKFDNISQRKWATYYGGEGAEVPNKIAINSFFDDAYIIGTVESAPTGKSNTLPEKNITGA